MRNLRFISALCTVLLSLPAAAEEPPAVEDLVARVRASIVTIRHAGRGQRDGGLGTGFVVAADGLIATNLHVIGEARPITVELADGTTHEATAVHASDRTADLAVVRIDARDLTPLPLGPANGLADGQEVVAVGNPHGLERSVVTGRLSARRQIDGIDMLQLAIPIESGNSGGPLMDRAGQVHGILTMKSLVTPNLGFAVEAKRLRSLLDEPNPVVIERWLTIGALDPDEWTVVGGARWRQRAGALAASGSGQGFGGRSLCLATKPVPERPYEVAVRVKLADESGAAGLAFAADGGDRHYGFYPSAGKLRLTRFDGPDVFSWQVLAEVATAAYRPGDWNHLRVRVTTEGITCFVNDEQVILSADGGAAGGRTPSFVVSSPGDRCRR
jgi:serine protease Do